MNAPDGAAGVAGNPYRSDAPLPVGGLAIEASAGTGKTYALADLATRFVAERGVAASELLVVTFTRAATDELRSRLRLRFAEVADALDGRSPTDPDDTLLARLDRTGPAAARLRAAVAEFDALMVTTIHGFANQVRSTLGVEVDVDPDARVVQEPDNFLADLCADVLVEAALGEPDRPLPGLDGLVDVASVKLSRPELVLVPTEDTDGADDVDPSTFFLIELVGRAVARVRQRRRRTGTRSFDDLSTELADAVAGEHADAATDTLRSRFKVVLIDEFQDTDPVQWSIFRTLFTGSGTETSVVVVGDPKQAIYGFRGGDVGAYLDAVRSGALGVRRSLSVNWRSDGAVVDALDALLTGATFGDADIPFVPVEASPAHRDRRLHRAVPDGHRGGDGAVDLPALALRVGIGANLERGRKGRNPRLLKPPLRRDVVLDLVAQVRSLLDGARVPVDDGDGDRRLRPRDIAVLVPRHQDAEAVQVGLDAQGVPAVLTRSNSVLEAPAANQVRWLLTALGRPSDPYRARLFALSWFGGLTAAELDAASDVTVEGIQEHLREWATALTRHTVADVLARIWEESGVRPRILGRPGGDRDLTDLDHLAELLGRSTTSRRSSVAALLAALDTGPAAEADPDAARDATLRRIESEAEAVQVMTMWAAKGLEFPVVCLPFLWDGRQQQGIATFRDPDSGSLVADVTRGGPWPTKKDGDRRKELCRAEATGEMLRLAYVALTRARHHTVVWWGNAQGSERTALARMLFARNGADIDPVAFTADTVRIPPDQEVVAALSGLVERSRQTISVAPFDAGTAPDHRWESPGSGDVPPELQAATFDVTLDRSRHRWSFSAILDRAAAEESDPYDADHGDAGAADEAADQDEAAGQDETADQDETARDGATAVAGSEAEAPGSALSPLVRLPAGTAFGTMVHAVLERTDFSASPDRRAESLAAVVDEELAWRELDLSPPGEALATAEEGRRLLVEGLGTALDTPLGPQCGDLRLADVAPGDRLNEVSFDLRLGDGGRPARLAEVGRVVVEHLTGPAPLRDWARRLVDRAPDLTLAGHLTGSIDLVLRLPDATGGHRYVVADYKTNALTPRGRRPDRDDYGPGAMARAMVEHAYPLQALLYEVALHRYLRWRLPGYEPGRHLGGAVYLFLRGMAGPGGGTSDGTPHGVYGLPVPAALVTALSDLLAGAETAVER